VAIVIKSLLLNDPSCQPCFLGSQTRYYYNTSGDWLNVTLGQFSYPQVGFCNAVLEVVAPTQLIITGALNMNQPGSVISQLRLITVPTNATLRP